MENYIENLLYQAGLIGKFTLSLLLGLIVGFERELAGKPAGMRTYAMITASTTALVLLGLEVVNFFNSHYDIQLIASDPTRIIHAIVIGISFLGTGTILKDRDAGSVHYLTTAATILGATAIGISIGLSNFLFAFGLTFIIILVNWILGYPERWIHKKLNLKKNKNNSDLK